MVKTIFSGAWRIGRVTALAVGLAVMLALALGVASTALAGKNRASAALMKNVTDQAVTALTGLKGALDGAILKLDNDGTGANATALELQAEPGKAPMTVNSDGKVTNLNADKLDGLDYTFFARNAFYRTEGVYNEGLLLGDGTHKAVAFCEPGDVLLSGGSANIDKETDLLESFPEREELARTGTHRWIVRVDKNGFTDNFNAVVLCIDQFNP